MKFKVGMCCILRSGSPMMTIAEVHSDDIIKAVYFVGDDCCEIELDKDCFIVMES